MNMMGSNLRSCQWCQGSTCDACDELETRIRANPEMARRMLAKLDRDAEAPARLKALDDSKALEEELSAASNLQISHLWAVWADEHQEEILYAFNPGNSSDCCNRADRGQYRKEELRAWANAKCSYHLRATSSV
jgi:hypothetical protein